MRAASSSKPVFGLRVLVLASLLAAVGAVAVRGAKGGATADRLWVEQLGSAAVDVASAVSADGRGDVYVAGATYGSLDGANAGDADAFLAKLAPNGSLLWVRQLGTPERDSAAGVSVGVNGVYVAGLTFGDMDGANAGDYDTFLARYDTHGNRLWVRQAGTPAGEHASSVSADAHGNAYITGDTQGALAGKRIGKADAYLIKYGPDGRRLWGRQFGTREGDVARVTADPNGRVYLAGQTDGDLGGRNAGSSDAFLAAYTSGGRRLWTRQLGTPALDYANGVSSDGRGAIYIAGLTRGTLERPTAGSDDVFLAKYDRAGRRLWTKQLGTSGSDQANGVGANGRSVYIAGSTNGALAGRPAEGYDAFISRFDVRGNRLWTERLGTRSLDSARAVSANANGAAYVVGQTAGRLKGSGPRGIDAFIAKYQ